MTVAERIPASIWSVVKVSDWYPLHPPDEDLQKKVKDDGVNDA